jgi:hypothetical protein
MMRCIASLPRDIRPEKAMKAAFPRIVKDRAARLTTPFFCVTSTIVYFFVNTSLVRSNLMNSLGGENYELQRIDPESLEHQRAPRGKISRP